MISPCGCKGSTAFVHPHCIREWVNTKGSDQCEICHQDFCKREHCSFEPRKYIAGCCRCNSDKTFSGAMSITLWIVCFGGIVINFIPLGDYILVDAVATVTISVCAIAWGLVNNKSIHDVLLHWKLAASFPYLAGCLVDYLMIEDMCEQQCSKLLSRCADNCRFYREYTRDQNALNDAVLFDMVNIGIVLLVRSIFLCFVYMRNVTLRDRPEENERLLDDDRSESIGDV